MNKELYPMIFKRKSFHIFKERIKEKISEDEIQDLYNFYEKLEPLFEIKTKIKIVRKEETTCTRKAEYCILFFSEKKPGYLQNIGYLGEQMDLYLTSKDIGSLWFGIAKSKEIYDGLDYVIQIAIAKVDTKTFRKDMYKAKRKSLSDIWQGDDLGIGDIVRFAPSACNSQPWFVINKEGLLEIYRKSKSGKVGIMPKNASVYYNQIDIGIFMCFLELCLKDRNITYKRQLFIDSQEYDDLVLNAKYKLWQELLA